jgi:hypothetical protein
MDSQLEDWLRIFDLTRNTFYFRIPKKEDPVIDEIDKELEKYHKRWNTPFNYDHYILNSRGNWIPK